jgi:phosphoribosylanthranilate isomerase
MCRSALRLDSPADGTEFDAKLVNVFVVHPMFFAGRIQSKNMSQLIQNLF